MRSLDVPQANDLDTVRAVARAVKLGCRTPQEVADHTGYSLRHARYRLHAGRVLGLVRFEEDTVDLTTLGERLLDTQAHTQREREVFFDAVNRSPVLQILVPDLLSRDPPLIDDLSERIFAESQVSRTTARRLAGGLLTWRRRILGADPPPPPEPEPTDATEQLTLFG